MTTLYAATGAYDGPAVVLTRRGPHGRTHGAESWVTCASGPTAPPSGDRLPGRPATGTPYDAEPG